jgi:outer membrane receptor protein involved in Fe transport
LLIGGTWATSRADYDLNFKDPGCTEFDVDCSVTDAQRLASAKTLTVQNWELFVEDTWFLNDHLSVTPGVSFHTEGYLDKSFLEPRFRVEYETAPDWILTTGIGQYHQFPEFGQVEQVFGNPNLDHRESNHVVLGLEHFMSNGWQWKSELYYKEFTDLVTSYPNTRYSNDGEGSAYGVEALIKKDLTDRWSGWLSLSASKAERKNNLTGQTFDFDFDQPVIATLVAQYKLNQKWTFGAKWWYHSGSPDTPIIGGEVDPERPARFRPVYGDINSDRVADYHRLDIRADRKFDFKRVDMTGYIELINVYNHENVAGYDYNEDISHREEVHQLPMLMSFGIKAKF